MKTNFIYSDKPQENLDIEDELSCLTADLVEFECNLPFLEKLFSTEAGKWVEISLLCQGLQEIEKQLKQVQKSFDGIIQVAWLEYPQIPDYCLIIFFVEDLFWNNLALYNQEKFLQSKRKSNKEEIR
ncbi:hypothetical protein [Oscillatoria salina]|uniref:hypothetical protein n=1 Tax=Oscillatoria salina TaxID=331517 RepID=UPI001CCF3CDF|nr:hypothetical protein [Oscillatoria salina]MBZ8182239.1 hypothetical protein [Oscillatoria salina IIICB1]